MLLGPEYFTREYVNGALCCNVCCICSEIQQMDNRCGLPGWGHLHQDIRKAGYHQDSLFGGIR